MRPETWYRLSCPGAKGPGPWELDRDRKLKIDALPPYHRGQLLPHPGTGGLQRLRPDGGHSGTAEHTEARHPPDFPKGGPQEEEPPVIVIASGTLFLGLGCRLGRTCLLPLLLTAEP